MRSRPDVVLVDRDHGLRGYAVGGHMEWGMTALRTWTRLSLLGRIGQEGGIEFRREGVHHFEGRAVISSLSFAGLVATL